MGLFKRKDDKQRAGSEPPLVGPAGDDRVPGLTKREQRRLQKYRKQARLIEVERKKQRATAAKREARRVRKDDARDERAIQRAERVALAREEKSIRHDQGDTFDDERESPDGADKARRKQRAVADKAAAKAAKADVKAARKADQAAQKEATKGTKRAAKEAAKAAKAADRGA